MQELTCIQSVRFLLQVHIFTDIDVCYNTLRFDICKGSATPVMYPRGLGCCIFHSTTLAVPPKFDDQIIWYWHDYCWAYCCQMIIDVGLHVHGTWVSTEFVVDLLGPVSPNSTDASLPKQFGIWQITLNKWFEAVVRSTNIMSWSWFITESKYNHGISKLTNMKIKHSTKQHKLFNNEEHQVIALTYSHQNRLN